MFTMIHAEYRVHDLLTICSMRKAYIVVNKGIINQRFKN